MFSPCRFFSGILKEHGPLLVDDAVIVRELEDFPPEAQDLIRKAGGIDEFLLTSGDFAKHDDYICLLEDNVKASMLAEQQKQSGGSARDRKRWPPPPAPSLSSADFPTLTPAEAATKSDLIAPRASQPHSRIHEAAKNKTGMKAKTASGSIAMSSEISSRETRAVTVSTPSLGSLDSPFGVGTRETLHGQMGMAGLGAELREDWAIGTAGLGAELQEDCHQNFPPAGSSGTTVESQLQSLPTAPIKGALSWATESSEPNMTGSCWPSIQLKAGNEDSVAICDAAAGLGGLSISDQRYAEQHICLDNNPEVDANGTYRSDKLKPTLNPKVNSFWLNRGSHMAPVPNPSFASSAADSELSDQFNLMPLGDSSNLFPSFHDNPSSNFDITGISSISDNAPATCNLVDDLVQKHVEEMKNQNSGGSNSCDTIDSHVLRHIQECKSQSLGSRASSRSLDGASGSAKGSAEEHVELSMVDTCLRKQRGQDLCGTGTSQSPSIVSSSSKDAAATGVMDTTATLTDTSGISVDDLVMEHLQGLENEWMHIRARQTHHSLHQLDTFEDDPKLMDSIMSDIYKSHEPGTRLSSSMPAGVNPSQQTSIGPQNVLQPVVVADVGVNTEFVTHPLEEKLNSSERVKDELIEQVCELTDQYASAMQSMKDMAAREKKASMAEEQAQVTTRLNCTSAPVFSPPPPNP